MKRIATLLTVLSAGLIFAAASANAADYHHGPAYGGHGYGYRGGHGYAPVAPARHHGSGYGGYGGHGGHGGHGYRGNYDPHGYSSHGYSAQGHGGVRISTPHFGLRIGH